MIRLGSGHYLSPIGASRRTALATLVETVYPAGMGLPRHSHEFPYLVLMIDGVLRERTRSRTYDLAGGWLVYNEAGESHDNQVLTLRARCLNVELRPALMESLDRQGIRPRESVLYERATTAMNSIGRLYAALLDPGPEVEIEEALIEIFTAASARNGHARGKPAWIGRVVSMIHDWYPERPTLATLAAEAGVHEAHLCRGFRAATGCTVGQYVRRMRAGRALGEVTEGDRPLAAVAARAGFADQAHMTRAFTASYGRSPGRLRLAATRKVRSRLKERRLLD